MLEEARKEAPVTQEQLAEMTGTKKSYISRIERGQSAIQVSTYYKLDLENISIFRLDKK